MVDTDSLPWWQAAAEQRLTVQRCQDCNHGQLPPTPVCSVCRSRNLELGDITGKGTLYTFTTVHRPVAMDQELPFIIAVVELDVPGVDPKGDAPVRLMTNIVDAEPEVLEIGAEVEVAWEKMSDEVTVPRFRLVG